MRGSILLAKQANVPIVPVHLDGVWGSIFSMKGGKFLGKKPESVPYEITVRVGQPINPKLSSTAEVRSQVMELGRLSFNSRLKEGKTHWITSNTRFFGIPKLKLFNPMMVRFGKNQIF